MIGWGRSGGGHRNGLELDLGGRCIWVGVSGFEWEWI